jgi:hypothetical protein
MREGGDVDENSHFKSLCRGIPMAEIARHVGYVDHLLLREFKI